MIFIRVHVIDVTKKGPVLLRQNHLLNISAGPACKLCSRGVKAASSVGK